MYIAIKMIIEVEPDEQDAVFDAIERAVCPDHDNTESECRLDMMATCSHRDIDVVSEWLH